MTKGFSISKLKLLLVIILSFASIQCFSQTSEPFSINDSPLGAPTSPVMDYAGVLDANTKQSLEQRIIQFRDRSNPKTELAVAIVQTTGDRPIFDYSLAVARGWKIGSKVDDNPGALLLIAVGDRKYFTQISKDLEDELPDSLAGQLQRQYLVPAFKQGNYGKGVSDTIDAYIRTIESRRAGETAPVGETNNQTGQTSRKSTGAASGGICSTVICLIILFIFLISIFSRFGSSRRRSNGSGWRGGGFGGGSAVPWIVGSIIANSMSNRGSSGWGGGSSSGWSGGGDSGGSSWGGFGGGGDFGGGGAGGDW